MKTLEKYYDHQQVEEGKFDFWMKEGYFVADVNSSKPPFAVILPPPNVTGILHIGHAKNTSTIDTICRYKKLRGYDVLFAPGVDHAGIATQAKVEEQLKKEGKDKYEMGREEFLKVCYSWKDRHASYFHEQWKKLGLGMDYARERFTLDEKTTKAVYLTFKTLYDEGLIYQGERIINWDTKLDTALSNIEVEHKEVKGKFYYFKYRFEDNKDEYITIATTRPETMFGDSALVFNPKDERYTPYLGRRVINPANNMSIPLVADRYVEKEFGTGIMKCTPAHDPHDFEIGKRHNLPFIRCMENKGIMNEVCGEFKGLDRFVCREKLVSKIESEGNLEKIEDIVHSVGHSERSHTIIEPILSKQWFVKMGPLAKRVSELMESDEAIKFYPARFAKTFVNWINDTEDWCISRQLWWGHQIPVYTNKETGEVICSVEPLDPKLYDRDPDVLDTWFSSALSPFALMGWPDTKDPYFKRYFPNSIIISAYDILFFWLARMTFQSAKLTGKLPFKNAFLHGLVRDKGGKKMSKSSNNGIDPNEVCRKYGADALRYVVATQGTPGLDVYIREENYEQAKIFLNKIWNAARYVLQIIPDDFKEFDLDYANLGPIDNYIYSRFDNTISLIIANMDKYELGQATKYLYDFVYDDYCGTYLELTKIELKEASEERKKVIYQVLLDLLRSIMIILFPTCPFVSEEIYQYLPGSKKSIYEESYPTTSNLKFDTKLVDSLVKMIKHIRSFKAENKLSISSHIDIEVYSEEDVSYLYPFLKYYAGQDVVVLDKKSSDLIFFDEIGIKLKLLDDEASTAKLAERIALVKSEILRAEKMLGNPGFVNKAPKEKIEAEKAKLKAYQEELERYQ